MTFSLLFVALFIIFIFISNNKERSIEETEIAIQRTKSMIALVPIGFSIIVVVPLILNFIMPVSDMSTVATTPFLNLQDKITDISKVFIIMLFIMIEAFYFWTLTALKSRLAKLQASQ